MISSDYVWAKVLSHMEDRLGPVHISAWFDDAKVIELNDAQLQRIGLIEEFIVNVSVITILGRDDIPCILRTTLVVVRELDVSPWDRAGEQLIWKREKSWETETG